MDSVKYFGKKGEKPTALLANKMQRYLNLFCQFFKNCWMREMEFRFNFAFWIVFDLLSLFLLVFGVTIVFGQVEAIAGWQKEEVLLLVYTQAFFLDFLWTFILINLGYFSDLIRRGDLDFILLRPVNTRFLISVRYFSLDHILRMGITLYLIFRQVNSMQRFPSLGQYFVFFLLFFLAIFIFYNFFFILTTANIWLTDLFNLGDLFDRIIGVARYPTGIFKGAAEVITLYFVPIAFIATIPVSFLLGKENFGVIFSGLGLGLIFFCLSHFFWHFALKHYSSASS